MLSKQLVANAGEIKTMKESIQQAFGLAKGMNMSFTKECQGVKLVIRLIEFTPKFLVLSFVG